MQETNIFYHPYYPLHEMQQFTTLLPCLHTTFHYIPSYQNYLASDLYPLNIISSANDSTQNAEIASKTVTKSKSKLKNIKRTAGSSKPTKQKVQLFRDQNIKIQQSQLIEQKEGRNANSNLLRMFFRRLQNKIQDNPQEIQFVINKFQMKITLPEFIEWLRINKVDYRNYIRIPTIQKFFVDHQFVREHTKVMRILFKDFIHNETIPCYLTSKKVRREVMTHNYRTIRNIFNQILNFKS